MKRPRDLQDFTPRTLAKRVRAKHLAGTMPPKPEPEPESAAKFRSDDPSELCPALTLESACRAAPECAWVPSYRACLSRRAAAGVRWIPELWGHSKEALKELRKLHRDRYGYSERISNLAWGVFQNLLEAVTRGLQRAWEEYRSDDPHGLWKLPPALIADLVMAGAGVLLGFGTGNPAIAGLAVSTITGMMAGRVVDKIRGSLFEEVHKWAETGLDGIGISRGIAPVIAFGVSTILQLVLLWWSAMNVSTWTSAPGWISSTLRLYLGVSEGGTSEVGALWGAAQVLFRMNATSGIGIDLRDLFASLKQSSLLTALIALLRHIGVPLWNLFVNPGANGFMGVVRLAEAIARAFFQASIRTRVPDKSG